MIVAYWIDDVTRDQDQNIKSHTISVISILWFTEMISVVYMRIFITILHAWSCKSDISPISRVGVR